MMKITKCFILFISIFVLSNLSAFELFRNPMYSYEYISPQQEQNIINFARAFLPQRGVLKENKDGFVYLKVDDAYINKLFPLIHNHHYTKPPYFRNKYSPGAHISVFYIDERNVTGRIKEIGKEFKFTLNKLIFVPEKTQRYLVLTVNSPQLEELRTKYGLSPLLKNHDFHITIAKKKHYYRRD